jgi:hypothetical protein
MFRIIIAPLVWVLIAFCATGLIVAMLYRAAAIEGKIPVGFFLFGIAVGGLFRTHQSRSPWSRSRANFSG